MKWYGIAVWKSMFVSIAIIITGLITCELWFFLENGEWGGRSFFGAVFLAPITFMPLAKCLKIPYKYSLDFCATSGCLMLTILKVECLIDGCCKGIVLYRTAVGEVIRFPSQFIEVFTAFMLTALLISTSRKTKYRGKIYPITLVLYGVLRFVLNLLRDDWYRMKNMGLLLPLGNIWSLLAIGIGMIWLIVASEKKK